MNLQENISLSGYSTMRLGGVARYMVTVTTRSELQEAVNWAEAQNLPLLIIGGGSNIVWKDEGFAGLVIVNQIMRFESFDEDGRNVYITAGAGENWDSVVAHTTADGLTGIEALSLIPGTTGATPVQNVGAYGQEIAGTVTTIEAYDRQAKTFVNLPAMDCGFGYRTSRFKTTDKGRFLISAITLHLMRGLPEPPFYQTVTEYLNRQGIDRPTPQNIRDVVMAIRSAKLPDPVAVANNGSFFANPVISEQELFQIQDKYPDMPHWPASNGTAKVPAAWLIDQAGFRDFHDETTGMATWPTQSLVFINEHATSTADLLAFRQKVTDAVQARFGISLVQEPELLPT
ncbi:UDP-N-acetylmuramate dehydrogenase [Aeromicrobium sp.]|nr:UDP-N-acetylmuramate dehydrogenase [Candidatus Saccharibacteria bacterium]